MNRSSSRQSLLSSCYGVPTVVNIPYFTDVSTGFGIHSDQLVSCAAVVLLLICSYRCYFVPGVPAMLPSLLLLRSLLLLVFPTFQVVPAGVGVPAVAGALLLLASLLLLPLCCYCHPAIVGSPAFACTCRWSWSCCWCRLVVVLKKCNIFDYRITTIGQVAFSAIDCRLSDIGIGLSDYQLSEPGKKISMPSFRQMHYNDGKTCVLSCRKICMNHSVLQHWLVNTT